MKYKHCWLARETQKGWRVAFSTNKHDYYIPKITFVYKKDVEKVLKGNIVFVHLAKKIE